MTALVRDHTVVAGAVLRVWSGEEVVGGAFLVAPDLVATSANVLAEAAGAEPGALRLDFPLLRTDDDLPVRVRAAVERRPADDVALLRLAGPVPAEARMPPLRRVEELAERSFSVLGFPEGLTDGIWATGHIERVNGRNHLPSAAGEQPVVAGFSGAPVWEARTGAVVGMVVQRHGDAEVLPIDAVIGHDPDSMPGPYQGLRVFDESHADLFFGRDIEIRRLLDAMDRVPVVAVAGPSGAGKSSLVRAGLVPRLRAAGVDVEYIRAEPGTHLPEPRPAAGERGVVIVVDQFEELAALDPAAARDLFEQIVRRTGADATVRAVLTMRWTTLDELLTPELVSTLETGTVLVGPLDRAHLYEAIVRPAGLPPGLAFEPGLVETILDDAGAEPGRLPLVESLLADLWERHEGGFLTLRDYEAAGGVAGALAQHAEAVIGGLPPGSDGPLRRLLTALARPDHDGRFVRRPIPLDELPEAQRPLVPALTAGRLMTVSRSSRAAGSVDVVELAHQALIDHWPRLQEWLAHDREFLSWREQVTGQRERWEAEDRDDNALLRGAMLARASEWLPARADDVPGADLDYVRRSASRQRREVRRWRVVTAVVAALTVAAAVLAVVSVRSSNDIAAQLAVANADTLGRESQTRLAEDPSAAAQLALAAWREDPANPQARAALGQSYVAMRSVERELPGLTGGPIQDLFIGGDTALLRAAPHPVLVTGLSGPAPRRHELADVAPDSRVVVSQDGRWLADQAPDLTTIRLRDLTSGSAPISLPRQEGRLAGFVRFAPDSERVVWADINEDGTARMRIWDLRTNAEVPHGVGVLGNDVWEIALTVGTGRVLVRHGDPAATDSRLVVHSLADGAELATLPAGAQLVLRGRAFVTCEENPDPAAFTDTLVVTPLDGTPPRRIELVTSCLTTKAVSSGGTALIERESGRTFRITDLLTGSAFHVTAPAEPPVTERATVGLHRTLDILPSAGGMSAVLARGSALLVLRGEPVPAGATVGEPIFAVERGLRIGTTRDGFYVDDHLTGRRLGEVTGVNDRDSVTGVDNDGSVWNARLAPDGWRITRHELPTLRPAEEMLLPSRDGGPPRGGRTSRPTIALAREPVAEGGRLFAIGDGVLMGWDVPAARPIGPPIPLGATEQEAGWYRGFPHMHLRPGHPGQVAVLGTDAVQIWDVPLGQLVATLPADPLLDPLDNAGSPIAFDASGDRLAVLGQDRALQLWDVDTVTQVRPPIPAPTVSDLHGFDADGYLVVTRDPGTGSQQFLAFIDLGAGFEAGFVETDEAIRDLYIDYLHNDLRTVRLDYFVEAWFLDLPITAQAWRDGLCSVVDRPFTPGEQQLLPPGTTTEPGCRR